MSTSSSVRAAQYKMSTFIFLYFFTWSSSFGLYALWLSQKVGLDSVTIGSVFAINGVFAVVLKPVYGYIMDKIGMSKWLLYFVCAISALMAPFFALVYQPLLQSHAMAGIIIGALYLSLAGTPAWRRLNLTPTALAACTGWSLAASECGVHWAGRWRRRSPGCCLTSRRWPTFSSAAVPRY